MHSFGLFFGVDDREVGSLLGADLTRLLPVPGFTVHLVVTQTIAQLIPGPRAGRGRFNKAKIAVFSRWRRFDAQVVAHTVMGKDKAWSSSIVRKNKFENGNSDFNKV